MLAQPHGGTEVPEDIYRCLNADGRALADTDWHISRLYENLVDDITIVSTPVHRYVVDVNRNPSDESLYPGLNTTGLCPTTTFDGVDIYLPGQMPSADEINTRQKIFHQPYHDALGAQLERLRQKHGYVVLYDCHSIRSQLPYLFEGRLPDFNIGTNNGITCDPEFQSEVENICSAQASYGWVSNGRFKGGWTTRYYGQPESGYHAIQMELAQRNYMLESAPWTYNQSHAELLRSVLKQILLVLMH